MSYLLNIRLAATTATAATAATDTSPETTLATPEENASRSVVRDTFHSMESKWLTGIHRNSSADLADPDIRYEKLRLCEDMN